MFHVGQKVVCVDDAPRRARIRPIMLPVKGQTYTIRDLFVARSSLLNIRVTEISNSTEDDGIRASDGSFEVAFRASRFRPVHTTDISIFEAMLVPTPKEKELVTADDPGCERRG